MKKRLMTMTACLFATFAAFAQAYEAPVGWATIDGTTTVILLLWKQLSS